jgi:hypothetical protein
MMDYKKFHVLAIAKVCHETNRAWCEVNGDYSQKKWEDAPEWQKKSAIDGVEFRMKNPDERASRQHDEWMKVKISNGWTYGETKSEEKKTHPCITSWGNLPADQQMKDVLFASVVKAIVYPAGC